MFQTVLELALSLISHLYKDRYCHTAVDVLPVAKALQLPCDASCLRLFFCLLSTPLGYPSSTTPRRSNNCIRPSCHERFIASPIQAAAGSRDPPSFRTKSVT